MSFQGSGINFWVYAISSANCKYGVCSQSVGLSYGAMGGHGCQRCIHC